MNTAKFGNPAHLSEGFAAVGGTGDAAAAVIDPTEGDLNLASAREQWRMRRPSANAEWIARDEAAFMHQALSTPCLDVLSGTTGSTLTTVDGRELLDFHGNSVHQVGYGHPHVVEAIIAQLRQMPFCPRRYTNQPAIELAERLGRISPGGALTKCLLVPGGAEAMSMALKLARLVTGKSGFVSFWNSFHGATIDTISIGGEQHFRQRLGQLLPGCHHVHPPVPSECGQGCGKSCSLACIGQLRDILLANSDIAAVVVEPVRCTSVDLPPEGYWKAVRELCDAHGVLLIFDEIPIGLGRTGRMFACEHDGVVPDILVLGKGLGGGILPVAAMLAKPELDRVGYTSLGHFTHEKNPVLAAAASATLDVIERDGLVERSRVMGERLMGMLRELQSEFETIGEVRGQGLLVGVELKATASNPDVQRSTERVMYASLERGLSFKVSGGKVLTLTPPLTITSDELDHAIDILRAALRSCMFKSS